jgi:chloride channel protein, CIC family
MARQNTLAGAALPFRRVGPPRVFTRLGHLLQTQWLPRLQPGNAGRTLLYSALVGGAAGLVGSLFYAVLERVQHWVLELGAGYVALTAAGEGMLRELPTTPFRPWILCLLPAVGALIAGLISWKFAPETRGGGADGIIEAFHLGGNVRKRVPLVKAIASTFCLGFGGSGGREGPIMQIGGGLGATVARLLRLEPEQQRILLVAGMAAGVAAVFRTPLGAALLAVEILHRDDFESESLIPSVLASVVGYSVFISIFGESTLFAHAPRYPFVPSHLPLYILMALLLAGSGATFAALFRRTSDWFVQLRAPEWLKPAIGGLLLGCTAVPILIVAGPHIGGAGRGVGILGGGYGAAQLAITGAPWLSQGWAAVQVLLLLGALKMLATSFTVGSGGSAGVFGPSLSIGALLGGAFGRAAALLLDDPRIDPGAFALVGMAAFWGGLAHCPLAALVLVCELAGSYDLLVPLMLASAVSFVALRNSNLYASQRPARRFDVERPSSRPLG